MKPGQYVLAGSATFVICAIAAVLVMHMLGVPGLPYLSDSSPP